MQNEAFDFMDRSQKYQTLEPLFADLSSLVGQWGFHSFIMTGLPAFGYDVEPYVIKNAWPDGWMLRYVEQAYFPDDPVSKWSMARSKPFFWHEARGASHNSKRELQIEDEASGIGLKDGLVFPMYDAESWQAVISLGTAEKCNLTAKDIGQLYLMCLYSNMAANQIRRASEVPVSPLSGREREILQWAAAGKTSWEISMIVGVTEGTVNQHLQRIRGKLNASNTVHAVANAIRLRQIHP